MFDVVRTVTGKEKRTKPLILAIIQNSLCFSSLSGLSPFLGDDDSQTLNNVLMCNW